MTETLAGAAAEAPPKPRRRLVVVAAILVLIGGLTTYLVLRHLDRQYGPIDSGNFGGPYTDRGFVFAADGTSYRLAPTAGATGQLITGMSNDGHHSVRITSIDTDTVVSAIRWSVYRTAPGGSVEGVSTPWRPFPAVIPAQGEIRLLITIHRPADCRVYPAGSDYYGDMHVVHWESLLHSHTSSVEDGLGQDYIRFC